MGWQPLIVRRWMRKASETAPLLDLHQVPTQVAFSSCHNSRMCLTGHLHLPGHLWLFYHDTNQLARSHRSSTAEKLLEVMDWPSGQALIQVRIARPAPVLCLPLWPNSQIPGSKGGVGCDFSWWIEGRKSAVIASPVSVLQPSGPICCIAELELLKLQLVERREGKRLQQHLCEQSCTCHLPRIYSRHRSPLPGSGVGSPAWCAFSFFPKHHSSSLVGKSCWPVIYIQPDVGLQKKINPAFDNTPSCSSSSSAPSWLKEPYIDTGWG